MTHWLKQARVAILGLLFLGCAGTMRDCSSCTASSFGADWVVVQMASSGEVIRCWELHNVSVDNEPGSDGIFWQSSDGHLVHIANFYNRVQVMNGDFGSAYQELRLTREQCLEHSL